MICTNHSFSKMRRSKKSRGQPRVVIPKTWTVAAEPYVPQWRRANPYYGTIANGDRYGMSWTSSSDLQKVNRMRDRYRGMGAYYGGAGAYGGVNRMKKAQKWTGFAQGLVKSGQSMLSGSGEYEYNSTFPSMTGGAGTPEFGSVDDELGAITVSFKEYLTDIYGNMVDETTVNNFSEVQYSINPGLERSFPFLSQFAANFDEYEMKQLVYTYKSTINTDSSTTNGQVGSVIMATNYIVGSAPFTDKNAMLQYHGSSSARVTAVSVHGVECDPAKNSGTPGKYIRSAPVVIGKDEQLYDVGVFNLAISGTPQAFSNQPIGELWVEYTVILRKPKVLTGYGQAISKDVFAHQTNQTFPSFWPSSSTNWLTGQQNNIGCTIDTGVQNNVHCLTITFPAWYTSPTEIKLTLIAQLEQNQGLLGVNYDAEPITAGTYLDLVTTGNMTPQLDMLMTDSGASGTTQSAVVWSYSENTTGDAGDYSVALPTFIVIIHVRPGTLYGGTSGTTAINNTLSIPLTQVLGTAQTYGQISSAFLSIEEYTQMSNPAAPPVLLDSNGAVATYTG